MQGSVRPESYEVVTFGKKFSRETSTPPPPSLRRFEEPWKGREERGQGGDTKLSAVVEFSVVLIVIARGTETGVS